MFSLGHGEFKGLEEHSGICELFFGLGYKLEDHLIAPLKERKLPKLADDRSIGK